MNRMMRAAAAAAILTSGLGSIGCVSTGGGARGEGHGPIGDHWRNAADPCYPERYNHAARQAVIAPFAQQVHNGHALNQTVWNYYFEAGTDKLTSAGMEKLDSIARTRPAPDPKLYIQASRDLSLTADNAGKIADLRTDLDVKRAVAIQKYMGTQPAIGGAVAYEVYVHDAPTPGINAEMAANAYRGSIQGYRGAVSGSGTGVLGTGGSNNLTAAPTTGGTGGGGTGAGTGSGGTRP